MLWRTEIDDRSTFEIQGSTCCHLEKAVISLAWSPCITLSAN